jgi:antitoxin (DNA-binding transcriptional repressor) of toxin-antitoxin stability system
MKTITIRDLRQRWPEAEAALQVEDEIVITRDSKPVAKLVRFVPPKPKRKRWDPAEHERWIKRVFGNKVFPDSDAEMAAARADRKFD